MILLPERKPKSAPNVAVAIDQAPPKCTKADRLLSVDFVTRERIAELLRKRVRQQSSGISNKRPDRARP